LLQEINADESGAGAMLGKYTAEKAAALKARSFDHTALGLRGMKYERLDQLTVDLLLGVR
jgi:xylose isomerase